MKIILASQSPRRKEFLTQMGLDYEVIVSDCEEILDENIDKNEVALHFACQKAKDVFDKTTGDRMVIGCDSVVLINNQIYGKPKDYDDAFKMIKSYCGTCNYVISGLCVMVSKDDIVTTYKVSETSKVNVCQMSDEEIDAYIKTGEPFDKAGAYGLQGKFNIYVDSVEGNVSSIVGLPTNKLRDILRMENIKVFKNN